MSQTNNTQADEIEKCDSCELSLWSCNRLQDLVYDDMSTSERRKLAVEIREHTSEMVAQQRSKAAERERLKGAIDELRTLEPFTHEGRGTILWEMDSLATTVDNRIAELTTELERKEKEDDN